MSSKVFPIQTATACPLKWNWSSLYLNTGITRSCHRTSESELTAENFDTFHNTDIKILDRTSMLAGKWPENSCQYCRNIEERGEVSDRMRHLTLPRVDAPELKTNTSATTVTPTILEVFFNNTCNLGCVYCSSRLSSVIAAEDIKFGKFSSQGVVLETVDNQYKNLIPHFWKWFSTGFQTLARLNVLGGEPLYQKDFDRLLEEIEKNPNPQCELSIITNLMISNEKLKQYVEKFKTLLITKKLKSIHITCSIDCWGPQQEYVRWGLQLDQWEENFKFLLEHKWLYLNINQTISVLTIKTMPEMLKKLQQWRRHRHVGHWFCGIAPGPSYMKADILGNSVFAKDIKKIINHMATETAEDLTAVDYMKGILSEIEVSEPNHQEIVKLITFLDEKDRRRGTNWEILFPWLMEYKKYVV